MTRWKIEQRENISTQQDLAWTCIILEETVKFSSMKSAILKREKNMSIFQFKSVLWL